jgi:hypothetical protein
MSLLHNLNLLFVFTVISKWINLKSLMDLDSAMCNTVERNEFLNRLKHCELTFVGMFDIKVTFNKLFGLQWIILRKVKVKCLIIDVFKDLFSFNPILMIKDGLLSRVEYLHLRNINFIQLRPTIFKEILNACEKLTSLHIDSVQFFNSTFLDSVNTLILDQIITFSFKGNIPTDLESVSKNLRRLENLKLKGPNSDIKFLVNLSSLIITNKHLRNITIGESIPTDDLIVSLIYSNCFQLETLALNCHKQIKNCEDLVKLIKECSTLQVVNIGHNLFYEIDFSTNLKTKVHKCMIIDISLVFNNCNVRYFTKGISPIVNKLVLFNPDKFIIDNISIIIWPNLELLQLGDRRLIINLKPIVLQVSFFLNELSPKLEHLITCFDGETLTEIFHHIKHIPKWTIYKIDNYEFVKAMILSDEHAVKLKHVKIFLSSTDMFCSEEEENFNNILNAFQKKLNIEWIRHV